MPEVASLAKQLDTTVGKILQYGVDGAETTETGQMDHPSDVARLDALLQEEGIKTALGLCRRDTRLYLAAYLEGTELAEEAEQSLPAALADPKDAKHHPIMSV